MTQKQRNVNLDLLRIVSMLLIVLFHSVIHSGVLGNIENCGSAIYFYIRFVYALCQVCVNIYIMLSGYFMITSKFRLQKLVTLWMEATFYALTLKLVCMVAKRVDFSVLSLVSCFFPILTGRYWFLTIYVGMYLISPFLNTLIWALDKHTHALLNLSLFGLMSLWNSIHPSIAGMNSGAGWGLAWFVTLYITSAWLQRYYTPNHKPWSWFAGFVEIPAGLAILQLLFLADILPRSVSIIVENWFRYDSAPVYVMTLCLFVGFLNIDITNSRLSRVVLRLAPLTLGIYLIHDHANLSAWIWEILALPEKMDSALFPVIQICAVLGIFGVCTAVEALRSMLFSPLERRIAPLCNRMECTLSSFFDKILTRSN